MNPRETDAERIVDDVLRQNTKLAHLSGDDASTAVAVKVVRRTLVHIAMAAYDYGLPHDATVRVLALALDRLAVEAEADALAAKDAMRIAVLKQMNSPGRVSVDELIPSWRQNGPRQ